MREAFLSTLTSVNHLATLPGPTNNAANWYQQIKKKNKKKGSKCVSRNNTSATVQCAAAPICVSAAVYVVRFRRRAFAEPHRAHRRAQSAPCTTTPGSLSERTRLHLWLFAARGSIWSISGLSQVTWQPRSRPDDVDSPRSEKGQMAPFNALVRRYIRMAVNTSSTFHP